NSILHLSYFLSPPLFFLSFILPSSLLLNPFFFLFSFSLLSSFFSSPLLHPFFFPLSPLLSCPLCLSCPSSDRGLVSSVCPKTGVPESSEAFLFNSSSWDRHTHTHTHTHTDTPH